ncbi:hypothetical protein V8G54_012376 [Vigna mungo]|uniref:Uncharacterized protein n=1 Tax=Vigna mungo TaxID=3915 RepID=A0AAQ3NS58_VIGMU
MFPYSSTPYPSFPSSSSSFHPFPFLNLENASASNTLLHDPLSVPYLPTHHNPPNIQEALSNLPVTDHNCGGGGSAMTKPDPSGAGGGGGCGGAPHYGLSCFLTKKPVKKDRHSKIYTSQGLRDRRVRLSIEIARKFFDLQDMLGFDKASNTLEWLFNKSKRAIKDLARSKNSTNSEEGAKSFSSSSECDDDCEVVSEIKQKQQLISADAAAAVAPNNLQQGLDSSDNKSPTFLAARERMKLKRAQKEPAKMKESREKARARARERTSNKIMCNVNSNTGRVQQDLKKKCPAIENSHSHHLVGSEAPRDDFNVIEESIVIKRKLKPSLMSSSHHHHQNLMIPKEPPCFNNNNIEYHHPFSNLSPNWDANGSTGRSNFCAIASMNLSTGLQIFGKSWEECTNPRLH